MVETLQTLEQTATKLASPFGIGVVVCPGGKLAVWPILRNANDVPPQLMQNTLPAAYRAFIHHLRQQLDHE